MKGAALASTWQHGAANRDVGMMGLGALETVVRIAANLLPGGMGMVYQVKSVAKNPAGVMLQRVLE